ncbi:adaptor protein, partial [Moniliophthora roreri]
VKGGSWAVDDHGGLKQKISRPRDSVFDQDHHLEAINASSASFLVLLLFIGATGNRHGATNPIVMNLFREAKKRFTSTQASIVALRKLG